VAAALPGRLGAGLLRLCLGLGAGLLPLCLGAAGASAHEGEHAAAPAGRHADEGAPPLGYELPAAGSYELPPIQRVADHELVGADGRRARLLALAPGQVAVVSFVYLGCRDSSGCPLALATLLRLDRALAERRDLAERVRLVSVSFDPARDRPEDLARLRDGLSPRGDWRFFTAEGEADLAPVLGDFGQDVAALPAAAGEPAALGHVLKVFLLDADGAVRNVYSTGFLDHRLVLRDVETLLLER
jgi:cytochrome oxidase Cu insertion factor (SCO1/SenC/PrrC family)